MVYSYVFFYFFSLFYYVMFFFYVPTERLFKRCITWIISLLVSSNFFSDFSGADDGFAGKGRQLGGFLRSFLVVLI